ncbi:MAG: STELLO glycosyltransferase family protein [Planctomycetota bacterium]
MLHTVITTIQRPTASVLRLAQFLGNGAGNLVIAGDTKGPDSFDLTGVEGFDASQLTFLDIDAQLASGFSVTEHLPTKHYCRKNVGYLHAIKAGASCIYETDDDNHPMDGWKTRDEWLARPRFVAKSADPDGAANWINVYRHFSDELIWPRGLPLDQIHESSTIADEPPETLGAPEEGNGFWAPIQQGLANVAPDVDAIWRLVLDREFTFESRASLMLAPGQWCPFNTQTTWWWPVVYPLLYVPSHCSFRMCDIWKSFVAQRCLWELGTGVVFHPPEVDQARNPHNLMRDFSDEVPGYESNDSIARILGDTKLATGHGEVANNLLRCYETLVARDVFPEKELPIVRAWIDDVNRVVT